MMKLTQWIWSVLFADINTLRKGVTFLKKALTPEISRPAFLPTAARNNELKSDNLRMIDKARLEEISQLVEFGRISSGIFHDLLNPLTTILLAIEDAYGSKSRKKQSDRENLERALLASRRIKDFVDVARKGLDRRMIKDEFNPAKEIRDVCELLAYKFRRSHVKATLDLDDSLSMTGCPLAFFRIALNLISNAIDSYEHLSPGDKTVFIRISSTSSKILLSISDRGCGIPKTRLETIFEPFYSTKKPKGLGIGLSTVKQLAEMLDGRIFVESVENLGTTFMIEFDQSLYRKKAALAAFSKDEITERTARLLEA